MRGTIYVGFVIMEYRRMRMSASKKEVDAEALMSHTIYAQVDLWNPTRKTY
ncbi:MAG: hypothetical protein AB8B69_18935 [Chitinophagales bacterium]